MDNRFFERPILNSPYAYPERHWVLDAQGQPTQQVIERRRRAEFITPIPKPEKRKRTSAQEQMIFDEGKGLSTQTQQYDPTPIIEGIQDEAIRETFKAFPSLQWVVAVDTDVNIYDTVDVDWAITTRFNAKKGFITLPDQPGHILNPLVEGVLVTKIGVDATAPYPRTSAFERVQFKDVNLKKYKIKE